MRGQAGQAEYEHELADRYDHEIVDRNREVAFMVAEDSAIHDVIMIVMETEQRIIEAGEKPESWVEADDDPVIHAEHLREQWERIRRNG